VLAFALGFLAEGIGQVRDRVQHLERSLRQDAGVQAQRERPGPSTAPPGQSPERSPAQAASPATPPGRGEAAHRQ
jgi:hypothetical protein